MFTKFLTLLIVSAFGAGCGLHAQSYIMTKQRVGIEKGSGNAGYLAGTPQYMEPQRKTRKVYVLEITKAIPESEVKKIKQQTDDTKVDTAIHVTQPPAPAPMERAHNKIVIPRIEDESSTAPSGPTQVTTYTVLKDDTLQKIAKKIYGSYGEWLKIYNANKDKITNPNFLRPGTVLTIPAAK